MPPRLQDNDNMARLLTSVLLKETVAERLGEIALLMLSVFAECLLLPTPDSVRTNEAEKLSAGITLSPYIALAGDGALAPIGVQLVGFVSDANKFAGVDSPMENVRSQLSCQIRGDFPELVDGSC